MSIEEDIIYKSISFFIGEKKIWTLNGPISADLAAGLIFGLYITCKYKQYNIKNYIMKISNNNENLINLDNTIKALHHYIITAEANYNIDYYTNYIDGSFGWKIINPENEYIYFLIKFNSSEFIQGFISITDSYFIDFRKFIIGLPFTYDKFKGVSFYYINGYDIEPYNKFNRIQAPTGAFYIDRDEADGTGNDYN